jgi:hypothetical protein
MEAHVTPQSQSFRLRQRAEEARLQHGQEVRADVPDVRVTASTGPSFTWLRRKAGSTADRRGEVFFCNMGQIRIREVIETGDDEPLPTNVVVEGLNVPDSGFYNLLNVLIRSNGDIRLIVDEKTHIEPTARYAEAVHL